MGRTISSPVPCLQTSCLKSTMGVVGMRREEKAIDRVVVLEIILAGGAQ